MKIRKTDLTSLIKEELSAFYVTPDAFTKEKKIKNTPNKPLQERKYLVKIEGVGNVIVDGGSEGEIRTRLSKKLRNGKKDIISISKLAKGKADQAEKRMGVEDEPISYDDKEQMVANESKSTLGPTLKNVINEAAKPKPKAYAPMRKNIEKNIKMINQSLKYADARAKKMPDNESLLWKIMVLAERLEQARDEFDSHLSFTVPSGSTVKR